MLDVECVITAGIIEAKAILTKRQEDRTMEAMAEDNMLQNLFCHKNIFMIIEDQDKFQNLFSNKKLSKKEKKEKREYIKE